MRVGGLEAAAVEDPQGLSGCAVEDRGEANPKECVRLLRLCGRRGAPGADCPNRFVGKHQVLWVEGAEGRGLTFEDGEGVAPIALVEGFTDAVDDLEAGRLGSASAVERGLVSLGEQSPPFGVADNRPLDTDFGQHRRCDLGGEGPAFLPMSVLSTKANL